MEVIMTREELIKAISKDAGISYEKAEIAAETFFKTWSEDQISSYFTEKMNE